MFQYIMGPLSACLFYICYQILFRSYQLDRSEENLDYYTEWNPATAPTRDEAFCQDFDIWQFASSATYDGDDFDPEDYDFCERIDVGNPGKYSKGPFIRDFGHGERRYIWEVHSGPETWVSANECPDEDQLKKLAQYCQCPICTGGWTGRLKCPCCYGCLYAGQEFVQDHRIKQARAVMQIKK